MDNRSIPQTNGWSSIGGANNPPPSPCIRSVKDDYDEEELIVEGAVKLHPVDNARDGEFEIRMPAFMTLKFL